VTSPITGSGVLSGRLGKLRFVASVLAVVLAPACSSGRGSIAVGPGSVAGSAGGGSNGSAGTAGGAGGGAAGAAGTNGGSTGGAGTAGTNVAGTAGIGSGTAGTNGSGTAGASGSGGSGIAGHNGAGGSDTAGTGGTRAPIIPPGGCTAVPAATDSSTQFIEKIVMVKGVDPAFIAKHPVNNGAQFNWTKRNYFLRLPMNYDPTKAYPVDMAGTGCAGNETTGNSGSYTLPSASGGQPDSIQIGLSYVTSDAANPSCVAFADDYVDSPEPEYISAVIDDVRAKYCVDNSKIFVNGYSSGAFEAVMSGCNDPDMVRAFGVQIGGGLRMNHPPCMNKPVAAMFVVGLLDTSDPIGPTATPQNDSIGSAAARDELLVRNGCVAPGFQIVDTCSQGGNVPCTTGVMNGDTFSNVPHAMWDSMFPKCQMYTGCPAQYPVVWCPLLVDHGAGPNPMGADGGQTVESYRRDGMWKFFSSLAAP
jgi:poly(3-hydroxybutyrate) depolymerase